MAPFFDEYYIWPFPISARSLTHYIHMRAREEPSGAEVSQELISSLTRRTNGGARIEKEARREKDSATGDHCTERASYLPCSTHLTCKRAP